MQKQRYFSIFSVVIVLSFLLLFSVHTNALAKDAASQLADHFLNKTPAPDLIHGIKLNQAMQIQAKYVSLISKEFGPVIGYKAGLTSEVAQKTFGVSHPLRGTLLKKMLLKSGTVMKANFGVRPLHEGDLILRVKDSGINKAKTPMEIMSHIDAAIPFIELPDLLYEKGVKINGPKLAANNVAARYGVAGGPILIKPTKEWFDRLEKFKLQILDEKGNIVVEGLGSNVLGHPLNVVLWIKDSLNAEGVRLEGGDLLSLGTITKLLPPKPGTTVRARYIDLDPKGPVEISVTFE